MQFSFKTYVKLLPSYSEPLGLGIRAAELEGRRKKSLLFPHLVSPTRPALNWNRDGGAGSLAGNGTSKCACPTPRDGGELKAQKRQCDYSLPPVLGPRKSEEVVPCPDLVTFRVKMDPGRMLQPCPPAISPIRIWLTRSWSIWDCWKACVYMHFCVCLSQWLYRDMFKRRLIGLLGTIKNLLGSSVWAVTVWSLITKPELFFYLGGRESLRFLLKPTKSLKNDGIRIDLSMLTTSAEQIKTLNFLRKY